MRTVIGIIVGYLIFALSAVLLFQLTHQAPLASAPATFIVLTTLYGMLFAALGGYAAQRIAPSGSGTAAAGVTFLIGIGALISLVTTWRVAAHWSQWTALFFMAPMAVVGGRWTTRIPADQEGINPSE